jgi:cell division protein FtsB
MRPLTPRVFLSLLIVVLIGLAMGILGISLVAAQGEGSVRSELVSLKSDFLALSSRVSRLESEVNRLGSSATLRQSPPPQLPSRRSPPIVEGVPIGRSDPMFERLANLVIELKERVNDLEKRMTQLEEKKTR